MDKSLKIESGLQLFSRITVRPSLDNLHPILFPDGGPQPNTIIQITGAESTGKSYLIGELIARCILPRDHDGKTVPGKQSGAIFINLDHHLNVLKLIAIMESMLRGFSAEQVKSIVEGSLKRLTVLNCYGSEHASLTFRNLEKIVTDDLNVNFLAIDGIAVNYWYDRVGNNATSLNSYIVGIILQLNKVIKGRNLVTVFTKLETDKHLSYMIDFTVNLKKVDDDNFVMLFHQQKENKSFSKNYVINKFGLCFDTS